MTMSSKPRTNLIHQATMQSLPKFTAFLLVCSLCANCSSAGPQHGGVELSVRAEQAKAPNTAERPKEFSRVVLLSRTDWVVTDEKSVWKTEDAGKNWKRTLTVEDDKAASSSGLHFINSQTGFVVLGYVFGTVDGGKTWTRLGDERFGTGSVFFKDSMNGWIAGFEATDSPEDESKPLTSGSIWRTRDGGKNWEKQRLPKVYMDAADRWYLKDIYFSDALNGWAVGRGVFLHSGDGGESWSEVRIHDDLAAIAFANRNVGWAVWRESGEFRLTVDGGKTWKLNQKIVQNADATIVFVSDKNGFAIQRATYLIGTTDGGETWEPVTIEGDPLAAVRAAPDLSLDLRRAQDGTLVAFWVSGDARRVGSVFSTDEGKSWHVNG